jgi:hypothetical protein
MKSKHIGSSFDNFLKEEGIYEEATGHAIKRAIAWQLAEAMKEKRISKAEMASRLKTSRTVIDHLRQRKAWLRNILSLAARGTAAALLAGVVVIIMVLLVGVALPIWTMLLFYGTRDVQDSPAHGGIVLFKAPIAALLGIPLFLFMTAFLFKKLHRQRESSPE